MMTKYDDIHSKKICKAPEDSERGHKAMLVFSSHFTNRRILTQSEVLARKCMRECESFCLASLGIFPGRQGSAFHRKHLLQTKTRFLAIALRQFQSVRFGTRALHSAKCSADVSVLIVGAGPVGTYLSILLSNFGIDSTIVERSVRGNGNMEDNYAHPRAHVLNTRTMELMRFIGLQQDICKEMPPTEQWRHFRSKTGSPCQRVHLSLYLIVVQVL